MASAQDRLFEIFAEIAGEQAGSPGPVVDAGRQLADSLQEVTRQIQSLATAVPSVEARQESGGGVLDTLESVGESVLKNALGAAPLIRGVIGLFGGLFGGGDDEAELPPLVKFELPPSIQFTAAETEGGFRAVDFDQQGLPRVVGPGLELAGQRAGAPQQVTVNVQAMDARSFLDRSTEIAAAVREAVLNLNSINDVITEI